MYTAITMLDTVSYYGLVAVSLVVFAMADSKARRLPGGWAFETWQWIRRRVSRQ